MEGLLWTFVWELSLFSFSVLFKDRGILSVASSASVWILWIDYPSFERVFLDTVMSDDLLYFRQESNMILGEQPAGQTQCLQVAKTELALACQTKWWCVFADNNHIIFFHLIQSLSGFNITSSNRKGNIFPTFTSDSEIPVN